MSVNYITVNPSFTPTVSNVDVYAVCFNADQDHANVSEFVYNQKGNFNHSIKLATSGNSLNLLQRHTDLSGNVENISNDLDNHVYLVSLVDVTKESDALNETMKEVYKMS
jgi:hypothetical protein